MTTEHRQDARKGARIVLAGIGLVALSVGLTIVGLVGSGSDRFVFLAVGIAGLVLFGTATSILARRILRASPLLTVTPIGIELPDAGLLRWEEIAEIRIDQVRGQRFLGIVPRDVESHLQRLPFAKRALARLNMSTGFAPIAIPETGLAVSLEELTATIEQHRRGELA